MRSRSILIFLASALLASRLSAQIAELSKTVKEFVRLSGPKVVLTHVRVIDGTGAPSVEDQNVTIEAGKITAIQPGVDVPAAGNTTVLDLRGYTVMPGIVGMHNHLFYIARPNLNSRRHFDEPLAVPQMTFTARPAPGRHRALSRGQRQLLPADVAPYRPR
jgi:predicted amidohydrolase YtcJ